MTITSTHNKNFAEYFEAMKQSPSSLSEMSPERLEQLNATPHLMTDSEHSEFCSDGFILIGGTSHQCPRCKLRKSIERARKSMIAAGAEPRCLDVQWGELQENAALIRIRDRACKNPQAIFDAGASLLLWSAETGTGKTLLASMVARAALEIGKSVRVASLARLSMRVRAGYKESNGEDGVLTELQAVKLMAEPDLLILDDLGAAETTSAAVEKRILFAALDERHGKRGSTIITSNLNPLEIGTFIGERVLGRLQPLTMIHVDHKINYRMPKLGQMEVF